jgi:hypothetical protein
VDERHVIGYSKPLAGAFLVLTGLEVAAFVVSGSWLPVALAALTGLLAVLYLVRPFLVLEDGVVKVQNLWGMTRRRFPFGTLADLEVEAGAIVIGKKQRLRFSPRMTSRADLRALAAAVRAARAARAPAPAPPP